MPSLARRDGRADALSPHSLPLRPTASSRTVKRLIPGCPCQELRCIDRRCTARGGVARGRVAVRGRSRRWRGHRPPHAASSHANTSPTSVQRRIAPGSRTRPGRAPASRQPGETRRAQELAVGWVRLRSPREAYPTRGAPPEWRRGAPRNLRPAGSVSILQGRHTQPAAHRPSGSARTPRSPPPPRRPAAEPRPRNRDTGWRGHNRREERGAWFQERRDQAAGRGEGCRRRWR